MAGQPSTPDNENAPFVFGSLPLRLPRHECFAHKVARGMTAKAAYKEMYEDCSDATAETNGPALLRTTQVRDRVDYLLGKAAEAVEMSKAEALAILADIARSDTEETKDKLKAMAELAKVKGYYAPEKVMDVTPQDTPEEVALRIAEKALSLHGKADAVQRVLAAAKG